MNHRQVRGVTIATSPFVIVGMPSTNPRIILLFPKTFLIGLPLPIMSNKNKA